MERAEETAHPGAELSGIPRYVQQPVPAADIGPVGAVDVVAVIQPFDIESNLPIASAVPNDNADPNAVYAWVMETPSLNF
jgi:hypothetical protein